MIKRGLQLLTFILIAISTYYGLILIYKKAIWHSYIIVDCPSSINQQTLEKIVYLCEQKATLKNNSWHKELKEKFPIIKNIQLKKDNKNILTVFIEPHTCKVLLNNQICISPSGAQYPLEQFDQNSINAPHIISEKLETSQEFKNFLTEITSDILEEHEISWHSPYKIYLKPKNEKYFILIRSDHIPNRALLKIIRHVAQQHIIKNMILDTRFNNQIIVFINRGGKDGKGIFR
ncbi:TPA: hypothetical protein DIC20_03345 [Candidatus Dependentiae bacterium]|nr:MAG: hypothetical protein US03_C0001G0059 [candidate division TM6 bacterium GW2011_GWF2_36_131]KKQ03805.1 MAG: hypothetical protein US13_C0001G0145 [candidate division TM6 bacterium GW2011_GWE2_36_25]KKQ19951.1 MAG: hypothetical protein US32_C0003G0068 [candidate division TM6 bacterium GW2011_GWA2_36_9]HBR70573.1 hypothetical protein [Candidatus Dependentiae bacterium]HCU00711.1 hypothetical protein [Candidatus Dependentiae bacterium]